MTIEGRPYINFYGASYLALSKVPEIRRAVRDLLVDQDVRHLRYFEDPDGSHDEASWGRRLGEALEWVLRGSGLGT